MRLHAAVTFAAIAAALAAAQMNAALTNSIRSGNSEMLIPT